MVSPTRRKMQIVSLNTSFCREFYALSESVFQIMYCHNFPRQILGLLGGSYIGLVVISNSFSFHLIILECKDHHSIQFFLLYRMIYSELSFYAVLTEKPWAFWKQAGFPVFRGFGGFNKGILFSKIYQRVENHFLYRMRYYSKYFDL